MQRDLVIVSDDECSDRETFLLMDTHELDRRFVEQKVSIELQISSRQVDVGCKMRGTQNGGLSLERPR